MSALGRSAPRLHSLDSEEFLKEVKMHLRAQALHKLESDRWKYEPTDRCPPRVH
jgi:hypothetical protein